jgi:urease accessory protein
MISTSSPGWHGTLDLIFAHTGTATQPIYSHSQAPLKLQRPFYPEGGEVCHSVILHTAGGMVGGDRLSLNLQLQSGAQVLVTTTAAAKVYRSNELEVQQNVQISVAAGACIEWLPQETIVFEQAMYRQNVRVELAPGATWVGWDITRFGRSARGERFYRGDWRSHTEIWQEGKPLWIDRQWLPGSETIFHSPNGLAGQPVVGSFAWVGQPIHPDLVEKARSLWTGEGDAGVTRLLSGVLCRYRGNSTLEARRWFVAVWQLMREANLKRPLCLPRVWQLEQWQASG